MKRDRYAEALEALEAIASLEKNLKTRLRWDAVYGLDLTAERQALGELAEPLKALYTRLSDIYLDIGRKRDEKHPPTLEELRELLGR